MEFKNEEDKNKALVAYSGMPEVLEQQKKDAVGFVKSLLKSGVVSKNDGNKLRTSMLKLLPDFPAMAHYTQIVLDEAKKQGWTFNNEEEKWK